MQKWLLLLVLSSIMVVWTKITSTLANETMDMLVPNWRYYLRHLSNDQKIVPYGYVELFKVFKVIMFVTWDHKAYESKSQNHDSKS